MERPIFSETLWEWRAFGKINPNTLYQISNLPMRHERTRNLRDEYLWVPECSVNVKLRGEGIRIKRVLSEPQDGCIKQWITQAYNFPISPNLFNKISEYFKLDLPQKEKEIQDREQLLSILQSASTAIQMITVDKCREQYFWPPDDKVGGAVIEHTRIHRPELVTSVSIEHENLDKVNSALKYLQLPSQSMKVLSYLDCLECWAFRRNCFKAKIARISPRDIKPIIDKAYQEKQQQQQ